MSGKPPARTVDEYIAGLPVETAKVVEELRSLV